MSITFCFSFLCCFVVMVGVAHFHFPAEHSQTDACAAILFGSSFFLLGMPTRVVEAEGWYKSERVSNILMKYSLTILASLPILYFVIEIYNGATWGHMFMCLFFFGLEAIGAGYYSAYIIWPKLEEEPPGSFIFRRLFSENVPTDARKQEPSRNERRQ